MNVLKIAFYRCFYLIKRTCSFDASDVVTEEGRRESGVPRYVQQQGLLHDLQETRGEKHLGGQELPDKAIFVQRIDMMHFLGTHTNILELQKRRLALDEQAV